MKNRVLPLGLDVGASRVRLASAERTAAGEVRVTGVATRDLPGDAVTPEAIAEPSLVAAVIEDLRKELGNRQRRCVIALPPSVCAVRLMRFPKMSDAERRRAARFEAPRLSSWKADEVPTVVRLHPVDRGEGLYAIGVARQDAIAARVRCLRQAGLVLSGIDHGGYAMRRAFPTVDAAIDVGLRQTAIHVFTDRVPTSLSIAGGGAEITSAIAGDLAIDAIAAEKRKRILGTAGAGEAVRDDAALRIEAVISRLRERIAIRHIALTGNGSRLPGLASAIESSTRTTVETEASHLLRAACYPDDVVRSAAPDWTMAVALATWGERR